MYFELHKSLYSDTLLPDIFITEYMPSMEGDYVKVYLYCLFLSKHNKQASTEELSKILAMGINRVKEALACLNNAGLISRTENGITLIDIKEKEIRKIYRMKVTSTPEEAVLSSERNKKRNEIITAINNTFFQGVMSPSWYTDIDAWFDRYKFDEDVMLSLFYHCCSHKGLSKSYIVKVAESWHNRNIKNSFDLDSYSIEYQKFKDVRGKIIKKLKLDRNLTEYEDEYVEKWAMLFKYDFSVIELALKKTTAKTNPNFNYLDAIITGWHKNGLKTAEEIAACNIKKTASGQKQSKESAVPQHGNFEQRKYDDDYYNSFFTNTKKGEKTAGQPE